MSDIFVQSRLCAVALVTVLSMFVPFDIAAAAAGQLAPHRAIYDMRLDAAGTSSGIAGLTGRMVFEFRGSKCEGYTQSMRLVTNVTTQNGGASLSDMRTSSWEDGAGKLFRFNVMTLRDSNVTEKISGNAKVKGDHTLRIDLTRPEKNTVSVEKPVMFPVQHSIALLSAARSGKRSMQANVYDGSENGKKIYATTAILGNRIAPGAAATNPGLIGQGLAKLGSWPVSVSYYEASDARTEGLPTYQMSFRFFENGVTRNLKIDYGNFVIDGTLARVEYLDEATCDAVAGQ